MNEAGSALSTAESTLEVEVGAAAAGLRLDRALADTLPELSRERLKALLKAGAVTGPAGIERSASRKVAAGERFAIAVPPTIPAEAAPQPIPLDILYEDAALIVVDKPAGLVVHPAAGNRDGTLVNALLHHCRGELSGIGGVERPGIVHRIDKDTSGILVVAKTDAAHRALAAGFADHSIERRYLALVAGIPAPPAGRIETALGRSASDRKKMAVVEAGRGKRAVTHFRTLRVLERAALVECRLETGRTHQVRVHMASKGHALLGDALYNRRGGAHGALLARLGFRRQALHAAMLKFLHPVSGQNLAFESPLPADMQELIEALSV